MAVWTVETTEKLNKLVEEIVDDLGYMDKSELIRDAVRKFIMQRNFDKLDLDTLEKNRDRNPDISAEEALEKLRSTKIRKEDLLDALDKERKIIIDTLFDLEDD